MGLSFWTQTIKRIRPGSKSVRGSHISDWDNTTELVIPGCSVQPASTSLSQDGRIQGITDGLTCYIPPTADIQGGDRVEYAGNMYAINGDPLRWTSPSGRISHIQLNLVRWRG